MEVGEGKSARADAVLAGGRVVVFYRQEKLLLDTFETERATPDAGPEGS